MNLAIILSASETCIWNDPAPPRESPPEPAYCELRARVSTFEVRLRAVLDVTPTSPGHVPLLGRDEPDEPLHDLEWHAAHPRTRVNDRMQTICVDCGEEIGR